MKKLAIALVFACLWPNLSAQIWLIDSIFHQNQFRYFGIYLPASYDASELTPAVLVLHGGGGTAAGTVGFTQMNLVADTAGFAVVYPQGGVENGAGGFGWAAGVGSPADLAGVDDVAFFDKLIDSLRLLISLDTSRIYSTGLSQGGFMSQRLACQLK